jgi:choline dehydrogenase-like flavoprotein
MTPQSGAVDTADAVVVGSGAGGGAAAALLAESGRRVLVLEAGPRLETRDFSGREGEMLGRLFHNAAVAGSGQALYAGRCVGGSTVVNDALCFRTPPAVLSRWREGDGLALDGFETAVDEAWAGIHATPTDRAHTSRNAARLAEGARALGWSGAAIDRSVRGCANLGLCNFGCPSGAKQSTLVSYVPRAERAGARVRPETPVQRVVLRDGAVSGVEAAGLRVETPLVVLAAGVLATPGILQRSGIEAGAGFQAHSSLYVTARFAEPVHGYYGPTMGYGVDEFAPEFMLENVTVHPVATATALPGFGVDHERIMGALPRLARCVVLRRDRSRGRVTADGVRYPLAPEDHAALRRGVRAAAELYLAAGAEEVYLPLQRPHAVRSLADADALLAEAFEPSRLASLYAVHLFGGAPMGASPATGVCDERGAVFGARGLYVADASALPGNTGVNPQITVLANALRVARGLAT